MGQHFTIRKPVDATLKIEKVIDKKIREILQARLDEFGGKAEKAFTNLDENPIWLNKEQGIAIKRVTVSGPATPVPIRLKRDKDGKPIIDDAGKTIGADFVTPGNNHHIAIFRDSSGKLQEHPVSFLEATIAKSNGLDVIDRNYKKDEGWEFLFTLKQNEYFVFPNPETGFNPLDYDLTDHRNYAEISPNLYRVQKISRSNYMFRHHLETTVEENAMVKGIAWINIQSVSKLANVVKVRIDNLGRIVAVGEYD